MQQRSLQEDVCLMYRTQNSASKLLNREHRKLFCAGDERAIVARNTGVWIIVSNK
jgi:tetraacyldisaccharide-1-P 4'-kinase